MYKSKTKKIIETDYISTDLIARYLGSKKFIDQLVITADKTIQTGKEYGFPAVRIFNEKTVTLPISEGTETEISLRDSYWHAPNTSDFYFFLDVHAHPQNELNLPNVFDLTHARKHEFFDLTTGFCTKFITCIGQYVEVDDDKIRDDLISLALCQRKNFLYDDIDVNKKLNAFHQQTIKNRELIRSDEKFSEEAFDNFYKNILLPHYNTGIALYFKSDGKWTLHQEAIDDYVQHNRTTIKKLLSKFEYTVKKLPIKPRSDRLDVFLKNTIKDHEDQNK